MKNRSGLVATITAVALVLMALAGSLGYWVQLKNGQSDDLEAARLRNEVRANQLREAITQEVDTTLRSIDLASEYLRQVYLHDRHNFDHAATELIERFPEGMLWLVVIFDAKGYVAYSTNGESLGLYTAFLI